MQFPSGIEIDRVDEEVGMDVLTVCVGADQNFVSLIVLGQLQRGRVSGDRVDCFAFREALYHVIEQYTVRLVVEIPVTNCCPSNSVFLSCMVYRITALMHPVVWPRL